MSCIVLGWSCLVYEVTDDPGKTYMIEAINYKSLLNLIVIDIFFVCFAMLPLCRAMKE